MPRSLYDDIHFQESQFVPQYIGSNYDTVKSAADTLDQRYRRNKELTDQVHIALAQDKLLQQDEGIRKGIHKKVNSDIDLIASSPENFENSTNAVMQIAKDYATNPQRLAAIENYSRYKQYDKTRQELLAKGLTPLDFNPIDKFTGTVHPETGGIQYFTPDIQQEQDYSGKMQQLLGQVADDGYIVSPKGEKMTFDDNERYLIKSGQVNNLTENKLNRLVEALIPSYKTSAEGKQDLRRLKELEGIPEELIKVKNNKGNIIRETSRVDEDIRNRFRSIAAPQAFRKENLKWDDFGLTAAQQKKNEVPPNVFAPTAAGSVTDNTSLTPLPDIEDDEYTFSNGKGGYSQYINKETGQPLSKEEYKNKVPGAQGPGANPQEQFKELEKNYTKIEIDPKEVQTEMRNSFNRVDSEFPGTYKDFDEYKASYNEAVKNHKKITPTGSIIQPEQKDLYKGPVNDASTPIYLSDGNNKPMSLETFSKQYKVEPDDIEFEPYKSMVDSPRKDLPGGYVEVKVNWKGKKGDRPSDLPTTAFRPISNEFAAAAAPIDNLYKNSFYRGSDFYTKDHPYDISEEFGVPVRDQAGNNLVFITNTFPIPKSKQVPGQPAFRTVVTTGIRIPNGSGGNDTYYNDGNDSQNGVPGRMTIGQWKEQMRGILNKRMENVLNHGAQTYNAKDFKDQGATEY